MNATANLHMNKSASRGPQRHVEADALAVRRQRCAGLTESDGT
jgi:hypothetical protein